MLVGLVAFYFYYIFAPETPPPSITEFLKPLTVSNERVVLAAPGVVSLSAKVLNPNLDFGAERFEYIWELYDAGGNSLQILRGESFIYPGEIKYIASSDIGEVVADTIGVRLVLGDMRDWNWLPSVSFSKPNIVPVRLGTAVLGNKVFGAISNKEAFTLSRVRIVGILFDSSGLELAISETELRDVRAFEERSFSLTFPRLSDVAAVDFSKTEIFAETKLIR
ncbi:MAG: hypothetical protein UX23_C0010G0014 [Parcubacteria group bacterium GW2011_GWB1_45_9]|nr:MAG: hypothetical protein UX23_C0010G0014 [Parcubacteria group bacterium GW2011_GWB1_45_9]